MKSITTKTIQTLTLSSGLILFNACGGGGSGGGTTPTPTPTPQELATKVIDDCSQPYVALGQSDTLVNRNDHIDYIITCSLNIWGDLSIDPDVKIEFGSGAGLNIDEGSLQAKGTAAKPILLTGQDKTAGSWKGLFFDSSDVKNELDYVHIDYAGGGYFNSNGDEGSVIVYAGAHLKMTNSTLKHSKTYGINAVYGGSDLTLENNTITTSEAPMYLGPQYVTTISGGTYTGNTRDAIILNSDRIDNDSTWKDLGVPYRVESRLVVIAGGGHLTIEPGVTIEFGANADLTIDEGASGSTPSLVAIGTAAKPITFTGIDKLKGAWKGIYVDSPHPRNEIAFANIDYASNAAQRSAIHAWSDTVLNIHDSTFNHIKYDAIDATDVPSVITSNNTFNDVDGTNIVR